MKTRNDTLFLVFALTLTTLLVLFWSRLQDHFNATSDSAFEKKNLISRMNQLEAEAQEREVQIKSLQASLNLQLREVVPVESRGVASLSESSVESIDLARLEFLKGNKAFEAQNYSQAIKEFTEFVKYYTFSPLHPKALFLLAESHYQMGQNAKCLQVIADLVEKYPEREESGYALLRMSEIQKERGKGWEANEILSLLQENFKDRKELMLQASIMKEKWSQ